MGIISVLRTPIYNSTLGKVLLSLTADWQMKWSYKIAEVLVKTKGFRQVLTLYKQAKMWLNSYTVPVKSFSQFEY